MRTAEEIIKARYKFYDEDVAQKDVELCGEQVQELINEARKEAIEECAERARAYVDENNNFFNQNAIVDKQSILSLIKELK